MTGSQSFGARVKASARIGLALTAVVLLVGLMAPAGAIPPGDTPRPVDTKLVSVSGTLWHSGTLEYVKVSATLRLVSVGVFRPAQSLAVVGVAVQKATARGQSSRRPYGLAGAGAAQRVVSGSGPVHVKMTFTSRLFPTDPIRLIPPNPIHPTDPVMPVRTRLDLYVGSFGISQAVATFIPPNPI